MKIVILSALGNEVARRCVDALLATTPADFDLHLVRERGFRERTLNAALAQVGTGDDVLFLGDDVELTLGWWEALHAHRERAEILGLCTLDAESGRVQDRGYDLAVLDGEVTLLAQDRGADPDAVVPFGFRPCDAVCGCTLYVRASVFQQVPAFREEGRNRFGEFVFAREARRAGARIGVVDHFVRHGGKSTKHNPDPALRSTSWAAERELWAGLVRAWVDPADVRIRLESVIAAGLAGRLRGSGGRTLVYGAGTVADRLARAFPEAAARWTFASGLPEEAGIPFHGGQVQSISKVPLSDFDWILITPLGRGERIAERVLAPLLPPGFAGRISEIVTEETDGGRLLHERTLRPGNAAIP